MPRGLHSVCPPAQASDQPALSVWVNRNLNERAEHAEHSIIRGSFKVRTSSNTSERKAQLSGPEDEESLELDLCCAGCGLAGTVLCACCSACCEWCGDLGAVEGRNGRLCDACDREAEVDSRFWGDR